jgi:hypothetical protein
MAVCNIFNNLTNPAGNFMMFSQYVEDITKNYVQGDEYKVVPSKYVALNLDYTKLLNNSDVSNDTQNTNLNEIIPYFYQNKFENGCAYMRKLETPVWDSTISKNIFWNTLFDYGLMTTSRNNTNKIDVVNEVMTYGTINIHAYDTHNDMGYGEIYCYIPAAAEKQLCEIVSITENRGSVINNSSHVEGFENKILSGKNTYFYTNDVNMSFEDSNLCQIPDNTVSQYDINTIVILYDVQQKINDEWTSLYSNIPMGVYITGQYENRVCTNTIKKYVSTDYGVGTSYGFRVCTRFSVNPNGVILTENELNVDADNYTSLTQLMCSMSESLDKMNDIMSDKIEQENIYKNSLQEIKNNRTNVPYIKEINGNIFWFINGRKVADISNFNKIEEHEQEIELIQNDINTLFQEKVDKCTPIRYRELVRLRNSNGLKPGVLYRITDYITTTTQLNTQSAGHPFDVVVLALDNHNLAEEAYVLSSSRDTDEYFVENNLSSWKIWYSLDNDTDRFTWADDSTDENDDFVGKGVIYRMIDEFGNDCPYDFKNIQFKHPKDTKAYPDYYYTFTIISSGAVNDYSLDGAYCYGNTMCRYVDREKQMVNGNVFINTQKHQCHSNSFGNNCRLNAFGNNCCNNSFGNNCFSNSFGHDCHSSTFGNSCHDNSFGVGCGYNSFGNSCKFICFGESTDNIKSYYRYITFDDGNSYINLNCTTTTSTSNYYQNVRIGLGVNNKSTYKTINDSRVNQSYETLYKPANSQTISI